ncbi:FAD-dependent thymidylate synthase [Streptomyces sp. SID4917]|nr:FAD-dependent thymidylate synthase [Streptomyces sp. SID4917]SCF72465.1 thymidylate synthase, flavin-dependent [Streptomyces sp. MnatMP-M17]
MSDTPADTPAETKPSFRGDVTVELLKHSASDTDVLWAARVSTAGEQSLEEVSKDPERSKGLINFLMRDRHGSPFEHNSMTFFISAPIFVFREFMRHRVGWCVAGDTEITLESESGTLSRRTIADLHRLWHLDAGDRPQQVRCYDEETLTARRARIVDVIESGVKPLIRIVTAAGRALRATVDHAVLTPDGWRKAGELTTGDAVLAEATERNAAPDVIVSIADDGEEMTYDLSVEGPWHNFLADGIVVHNSYNEESGRYRNLQPVFYVPAEDRKLVQQGRPGKYEFVPGSAAQQELTGRAMRDSYLQAYEAYQRMLAEGVAREVARAVLPVGLFSSMYATCNARSLMHFLGLRTQHEQAKVPSFPQREIEMVGERMEEHWAKLMPLTHAAFNANGRIAP